MPKARCDVYTRKKRCPNEAHAEVYWKNKSTWSYLCKKHFGQKRGKFHSWGILEKWRIEYQFWNALRKIEKNFGICGVKSKVANWCLFVEFGNEIDKFSEKILKSVEKHRTK